MSVSFWKMISAGLLLAAVPCFALAHPKTASSKKHDHASLKHGAAAHASATNRRGWHMLAHHEMSPAAMPAERATQIQTALIKLGYMTGEPTGIWDTSTVAAMQKLQGDNGWQTKITPDSRALIKLGLGPKDADPGTSRGAGALPESAANSAQDLAPTPRQ